MKMEECMLEMEESRHRGNRERKRNVSEERRDIFK